MSISLYTGLPGSGKSYGVVYHVIIPALKEKRVVYTNIPLNHEALIRDFGISAIEFHVNDIIANPFWFDQVLPKGVVLVLDEVYALWPDGMPTNTINPMHRNFLGQHRHLVGVDGNSTEIILVTQDVGQIARFVKQLVERTFRVNKLGFMGLSKRFTVNVYATSKLTKANLIQTYAAQSFKKEIYQYYISHTQSATGEAGLEVKIDSRGNVMKRFSVFLSIAFLIIAIPFMFWAFKKIFTSYDSEPSKSIPAASEPVQEIYTPVKRSASSRSAPSRVSSSESLPQKNEFPPFLQKAKSIYVAYSLKVSGVPNEFFDIVFADYQVNLSSSDLLKLGYTVSVINSCLVRITGFDYSGYAMCRSRKAEKNVLGNIGKELATTMTPSE